MNLKLIFSSILIISTLYSPNTINAIDPTSWLNMHRATGTNVNFYHGLGGISFAFSEVLPIVIVIGGLLLLVMLFMGGFTMLTNAQNPQGQEKGKQQITWAIVGFLLLFSAYWIVQILEIVFGIDPL